MSPDARSTDEPPARNGGHARAVGVLAVFADGSCSPVVLDLFTADPRDDPVRLAFPDIEDVETRSSARNGCLAVYRVLESMGHVQPQARYFPSCQFGDADTARRAVGGSAGLAFALQFAVDVCEPRLSAKHAAVVATGSVHSSARDAAVEPVRSVAEKARGALDILEPGGLFIYPRANDADLDADLRARASRTGVHLCPVDTVAEAVQQLVGPTRTRARGRAPWRAVAAVAAALAAAAWVADGIFRPPVPPERLQVLLGTGRWEEAARALRNGDAAADGILQRLTHPLGAQVGLRFMRASAPDTSVGGGDVSLDAALSVVSVGRGDLFRVTLRMTDSAFAYAYRRQGASISPLLGGPDGALPCLPDSAYVLPSRADAWFRRGEAGEHLVVVASRFRAADIEAAFASMEAAAADAAALRVAADSLSEALARRQAAHAQGLAVLVRRVALEAP